MRPLASTTILGLEYVPGTTPVAAKVIEIVASAVPLNGVAVEPVASPLNEIVRPVISCVAAPPDKGAKSVPLYNFKAFSLVSYQSCPIIGGDGAVGAAKFSSK